MSDIPFSHDIALRNHADNITAWKMLGERNNVGTTTSGEDLWNGAATRIPIPSLAGEQMQVVSTSANDTAAGTGARTLRIDYLDQDNNRQFEILTLNGLTPVSTVATNITFVNDTYVTSVGTDSGAAEGDITTYRQGDPTRQYDFINAGANFGLTAKYKVPSRYKLLITKYACSGAKTKNQSVRLRATCDDNNNLTETFLFKFVSYLNDSVSGSNLDPPILIPSGGIIKVTSFGDLVGGEVSATLFGYLYRS